MLPGLVAIQLEIYRSVACPLSLALSVTHMSMSVAIAVFALPIALRTLGSAGEAPELERLGRRYLGVIGVWMIVRAVWAKTRPNQESRITCVFVGPILIGACCSAPPPSVYHIRPIRQRIVRLQSQQALICAGVPAPNYTDPYSLRPERSIKEHLSFVVSHQRTEETCSAGSRISSRSPVTSASRS